jgi:hypothetical protein
MRHENCSTEQHLRDELTVEIVRLNSLLDMQGIEPERAAGLLIKKMGLIQDYKESRAREIAAWQA